MMYAVSSVLFINMNNFLFLMLGYNDVRGDLSVVF